jgi:hypothetical protein
VSLTTHNAGTVPGCFLNASTLGLSLRLCTFAPLRSNNPDQFRWLTHTGSEVPPSGLNPNSRIFCKIHYRAGSLREIHYRAGSFVRSATKQPDLLQDPLPSICKPSPLRKTTRFSHYGKNASFLKGSQYPQRTGARD